MDTGPDGGIEGLQLARRYQIAQELSRGALCVVHRGEDLVLRRPVAVKVVPATHIEVYRAALRSTGAFTHPAVVALYDAVEQDGCLFLVQEFIAGRPLSRYLKQGVPTERAIDLILQVARALSYAHHRDVAHGDLTPASVLVDRQATVRINNFGLPADRGYFDMMRLSVLTAPAIATVTGDVVAAALLLWQLLGGQPGERGGQAPDLTMRPDVPDTVTALVARCFGVGGERITTADDLATQLERVAESLTAEREAARVDTPPALRAARVAIQDGATWTIAETLGRARTWAGEVGPGDPRFYAPTDPGIGDVAATRAADNAVGVVPPRLRLPTRPLPDGPEYGPLIGPTAGPSQPPRWEPQEPAAAGRTGVTLAVVLILGAVLFLIFFLIGYLGAFPWGGPR